MLPNNAQHMPGQGADRPARAAVECGRGGPGGTALLDAPHVSAGRYAALGTMEGEGCDQFLVFRLN